MTTVTLPWDDPEDALRFREIHEDYRRDGWLPDPSRDSCVAEDGNEKGTA